jgi:protoheme IX farnesyltransferase
MSGIAEHKLGPQTTVLGVRPAITEQCLALVRLAKPGIVATVLLAGYAGMVLAARGWPGARTALLTLAALCLTAAGSALVNGLLDAPLDARMARLRNRTAALARVGGRRILAAAMGGIALGLLLALRFLNPLVVFLLLAAMLSYTLVYTLFLKRRSPWGAVPGGIPGALPVLIGYAAVDPALGSDAVILFALVFLWQPPHFWALALAYRRDYTAAGIPVLPEVRGKNYTVLLYFVYATSLLPASLALWRFGFCSAWYAAAAFAAWLAFIAASGRFLTGGRYLPAFAASIVYLLVLLAAIIGDICILGRLP